MEKSKTGIVHVGKMAARRKWDWAGHVSRMRDGRWAILSMQWVPEDGPPRRGRPRRRWQDELDAHGMAGPR